MKVRVELRRRTQVFLRRTVFLALVFLTGAAYSQFAPVVPEKRHILGPNPPSGGSVAAVATEDKGDFYVIKGQRIGLLCASEEVAVRYKKDIDPETGYKSVSTAPDVGSVRRIASFKPKGIDIISRLPEAAEKATIPGMPNLRDTLRRQPGVGETYPVLVNASDMSRMVAFDEVLVCLTAESDLGAFETALSSLPAVVVDKEPAKDAAVYLVRLTSPETLSALDASTRISGWPGVEWAEPNFIREVVLSFTPNDPLYSQQQSLHNTAQNGGLSDADVDAPEAWDVTRGSSDVVIAIIDDGVDSTHTDLSIEPGGYDFYNNDAYPDPVGADGHGTGCAGVAAGIGNNSNRISGIGANCRILPIKILEGSSFSTNEIVGNAIRYAADRADVLSNSWGGGSSSTYINTAIDYSLASGRGGKGSAVFFASGNAASGWYRGGSRYRLSTAGLSGSYHFGFWYQKDASISSGSDCVWIDNVCVIESDGYTHRWRQDFEGTFPPSGWTRYTSSGTNPWYQTSTGALTGTGGTYSTRSGAITHSQWTMLLSPLQSIAGTETLAFACSLSTQLGGDLLYVNIYDASLNYIASWGPMSGIPAITTSVSYPASYVNSIAVGASTDRDRRSDYSQYGSALDFVVPSNGGWNDIVTLDPVGSVGWTATDYKTNFGGTSSACPLAAGTGALLLARNPALTAVSIRHILRNTCDKIGGVVYTGGFNTYYGYGRINANMAVRSLCTVDAHSSPAPNLTLLDSNDTEAEKVTVLKFRITDRGQDARPLLIDQIKVNISGTAGHAANDIAWAELRDATSQRAVATGAAITNSQITFGISPNNDSAGAIRSVSDNTYVEFTVNLYLNAPLEGAHDQTYVFDVDETCVGVDGAAASSQMSGDSGAVTAVVGTLFVTQLSVTVNPAAWAIGPQSILYVGEAGPFTVQNTGNVAEDFTVAGTDGANGWSLAGSVGVDAFKVEADRNDDGTYELTLSKTPQSLESNVPVSGSRTVGLRYSSPSADTQGGGVSHDFTVTIAASRHVP